MKTPLAFLLICTYLCLFPISGNGQLRTIAGKIFGENNVAGIANADILECISKTGTISGEDGSFQLFLPQGKIEIKVTHAGYAEYSTILTLQSDTILNVHLKPLQEQKNKLRHERVQKHKTHSEKENEPVRVRKTGV